MSQQQPAPTLSIEPLSSTSASDDYYQIDENATEPPIITLERSPIYWWVAAVGDSCLIFELLLIIFYFVQFYKKNPIWFSVYYILLTVGYLISFIFQIAYLLLDLTDIFDIYIEFINFWAFSFDWYFLYFNGFWNLVIGIYRCTAIGMPLRHDKLWKNKQIPSIILVLIFPFLVNGYTVILDPYCKIHAWDPECVDKTIENTNIAFYLNIFLSFLTLFLILGSYLISKFSGTALLTANVERRLILQAILSTIFQLIFYTFYLLNPISLLFEENLTLFIGLLAFMFQHYSNIVVLFIVSKNFRHDLLSFYGLSFLVKSQNSSVIFVTNSAAAQTTIQSSRTR